MGLGQLVRSLHTRAPMWVHSAPATYTNAAHVIFNIRGGLVEILAMIEYCDLALTGATQTTLLIGAQIADAGAVALNAAGQFGMVVSPLGNTAKLASALVVQCPTLASVALARIGVVAGSRAIPAAAIAITWTMSVVAMAAGDRVSLHILYRPITVGAYIGA